MFAHALRLLLAAALLAPLVTDLAAAASPSWQPGMPAEVPPLRDDRLPPEGYASLADAWRAYLGDHPDSAMAQVQLARALRYGGAPAAEVREHLARALALGPDCPEALDAAASTYLGEWEALADGAKGCYELGLRAEALAPAWPDVHFTLHPLALALGRADEADRHLAALVDLGAIPAPVLDFCYNLLMSAAPRAIIFTNGDNDTYGTLALQVARGIRPDVLVFNLSLLSHPAIRETLHARLPGGDPLTAARRAELWDEFIASYARDGETFAVKYVKAVAARAAAGELDRPVYLATTVHHSVVEAIPYPRRLEGILWRILPHEDEAGVRPIDWTRSWQLFRDIFRLDSATDLSLSWATHRSVAQIMDNYPAVLVRVGAAAGEASERGTAREALRLALAIAAFHEREETVAGILEYWQELDPDNPEIRDWRPRED